MKLVQSKTVHNCVISLITQQQEDAEDPIKSGNYKGTLDIQINGFSLGHWPDGPMPEEEKPDPKTHVIMPVYGYLHGDLLLSTKPFSCQFDSGVAGIIFAEIGNEDPENIKQELETTVDVYNRYINGQVYEYVLKADDEIHHTVGGFEDFDEADAAGTKAFKELEEWVEANHDKLILKADRRARDILIKHNIDPDTDDDLLKYLTIGTLKELKDKDAK